jgi:hypothetical protein
MKPLRIKFSAVYLMNSKTLLKLLMIRRYFNSSPKLSRKSNKRRSLKIIKKRCLQIPLLYPVMRYSPIEPIEGEDAVLIVAMDEAITD